MRIIFITIFITSSSIFSFNLDIAKIKTTFESRIKKYKLKNGIRVILMKNGFSPTLACYLKVGVGSANEPFDLSGTAHFLEHLLFKGNRTLGTKDYKKEKIFQIQIEKDGERRDALLAQLEDPLTTVEQRRPIAEKVELLQKRITRYFKLQQKYILSEEDSRAYSLAGQVGYNAYTSADVTNYQVKLPKNRLEIWAALESGRFKNPVFREFYQERKVIQEERKMRLDSRPSSLLYEQFLKTSFGFSPYGKPVIGFASNIAKMRLSQTKKFFYDNYIPSRMVITIVGDLEFNKTIETIKKYFSTIKPRPLPQFPPISYEAVNAKRTVSLQADHTPLLITGWHKPSIMHKDDIVFEVLAEILTSGQTSRLVKKLVVEQKLAPFISAYNGTPGGKLDNMFILYSGAFKEGNYVKIENVINEVMKDLAKNGPTNRELQKVKNQYYASLISSLESNAGLANSLSYYELIKNNYREMFNSLEAFNKVSKEDIRRIIKTYIADSNNVTATITKQLKSNK